MNTPASDRKRQASVVATVLSLCLNFMFALGVAALADVQSGRTSGSTYIIPRVIGDGLEKYQFSGATAAISVWLQFASPRVQDRGVAYIEGLREAEDYYGKFVGYHVVSARKLAPATDIVYLVLNYERGPLFARLQVYEYKNTQYVTHIATSFTPEGVFPEKLLH